MKTDGTRHRYRDNVSLIDMERRDFLKTSTLTGTAILAGSIGAIGASRKTESKFTCDFAPHFGMFKNSAGEDLMSQLDFMADQGFRSLEDNWIKDRPIEEQNAIAKRLEKNGMRMGVFVAHKIYWQEPNLASGDKELRDEFLGYIKAAVDVAKRLDAKWMTVVCGHVDLRSNMGYQTANVVETLKMASEILEPHGVTMVLEPLNFRDHPGLFLTKSAQAYEICKAVDSPSCKILFDIYHQQIQEGNLIPNIDNSWDEIAYFQIGDNPGRKEPTTGEINFSNVFKHIVEKGYTGVFGMEHGNSKPGKEGDQAVIDAYRSVDVG